MDIEFPVPQPEYRGELEVVRANLGPERGIELLVRWFEGIKRPRYQIISWKPYPNDGWGRDEGMPLYRRIRILGDDKDLASDFVGRRLVLNAFPDDVLEHLEHHDTTTMTQEAFLGGLG